MPRFDGTGPLGKGAFTGNGMGYCAKRLSDIGDPVIRQALSGETGQTIDRLDREEATAIPTADGTGSMTARATGDCSGYAVPGFVGSIAGRRGKGWGGGRGQRDWFHATGSSGWQHTGMDLPAFGGSAAGYAPYASPFPSATPQQQELDPFKEQAKYFENALNGIRKRIEELEAKATK